MGRLDGKVALVTGGARGIGRAISERFVSEGCQVVVADILKEEGNSVVDELGDRAKYQWLDVTDAESWEQAAEEVPLDILVNNAGAVVEFSKLHETSAQSWDSILRLNLTSVFLGMKAVIPHMIAQEHGSIVNLSSISGVVGHDVAPAYQAAKGGIRVLTKNAAMTYVRDGIRANSIHPGIVETPMVQSQPEWATEAFLEATPMARLGEPTDVAYAAVYLASEESKFVTGAELYVDGGFVAQ